MSVAPSEITAAAGGAAAASGLGRILLRSAPETRVGLAASGLAIAAAVYPFARSAWRIDAAAVREIAGLGAFALLSLVAGRRSTSAGSRLLAAGWVAHAVFDAHHDAGRGSRLPSWYPAACAGFDLVTAAALVAPRD